MPVGRICRRAGGLICISCNRTCKLDNKRRAAKQAAHGRDRKHWTRLRTARLELDQRACQLCQKGCTGKATTVHLRPDFKGDHDSATITDVVSACAHCHGAEDAPRARRS